MLIGEDCRVLLAAAPDLKNIYLPQLPLLARATMRLGEPPELGQSGPAHHKQI